MTGCAPNCFNRHHDVVIESSILEEDNVHQTEIIHRRGIFVINILLWMSGVSIVIAGAVFNNDMSDANTLVGPVIYLATNVLLLVSGTIIVIFTLLACSERCLKMRMMLCTFTYSVTLVFVLQCIVAALSLTWRNEVHYIVESELSKFIRQREDEGNPAADKFAAMDKIQVRFHCCGAYNYTDWLIQSNNRTGAVPYSCCKLHVSVEDCSVDNPDNIDTEGCIEPLSQRYRENYLFMGIFAILVSVMQFALFHVTNYLIFNLE